MWQAYDSGIRSFVVPIFHKSMSWKGLCWVSVEWQEVRGLTEEEVVHWVNNNLLDYVEIRELRQFTILGCMFFDKILPHGQIGLLTIVLAKSTVLLIRSMMECCSGSWYEPERKKNDIHPCWKAVGFPLSLANIQQREQKLLWECNANPPILCAAGLLHTMATRTMHMSHPRSVSMSFTTWTCTPYLLVLIPLELWCCPSRGEVGWIW